MTHVIFGLVYRIDEERIFRQYQPDTECLSDVEPIEAVLPAESKEAFLKADFNKEMKEDEAYIICIAYKDNTEKGTVIINVKGLGRYSFTGDTEEISKVACEVIDDEEQIHKIMRELKVTTDGFLKDA